MTETHVASATSSTPTAMPAVPQRDDLVEFAYFVKQQNPAAWDIFHSETAAEFSAGVEKALDYAIKGTETSGDKFGVMDEVGLSCLLVRQLVGAYIHAQAEGRHRGHVDVTVIHPRGEKFRYLGECKIHHGPQHHIDGCRQLLDRYCTGRYKRSFCLDFFRKGRIGELMQTLRTRFDKDKPLKQKADSVEHETIVWAFVTTHTQQNDDVEILHLGCDVTCVPLPEKRSKKA